MNPRKTLSLADHGCKEQTHLERLSRFADCIEKGILDRMGEIGVPCKGLEQRVLGCIGMCEPSVGLKRTVRFVHSNFDGWTAEEDINGHISVESGDPGCFPKLDDRDATIYVFPTAKDALQARHVWKSAGLGSFPAYSLSGISKLFPGKNLVFVDLDGRIANPALLQRALRLSNVAVSDKIKPDLQGLRSLAYSDKDIQVPDASLAPELKPAGVTSDNHPILQGPDGYYVQFLPGADPEKQTNFTLEPKTSYASDYPVLRNVVFSELRIDGETVADNVPVNGMRAGRFNSMLQLAKAYKPGAIVSAKNAAVFSNAVFYNMQAEELRFPCMPCVCEPGGIVFPHVRVTQNGLVPQPQLEPIISVQRESHDYRAITADPATDEDMWALAGLMKRDDETSETIVLGICSWLHMAVSARLAVLHDTSFPDLCFEVHSAGDEALVPISVLYPIFSGDTVPRNSAEYRKARNAKQKTYGITSSSSRFSRLPGFFHVEMPEEGRLPYRLMYVKTRAPGLYAVTHSDLRHPLNAHGNVQCMRLASGNGEAPDVSVQRLRRAVMHILLQYVKAAPRIDPDRWMTRKPWLTMYSGLYRALHELGLMVPGPEKFERKTNGY